MISSCFDGVQPFTSTSFRWSQHYWGRQKGFSSGTCTLWTSVVEYMREEEVQVDLDQGQ